MVDHTTVLRVQDVSKRFVIRKEKSLKERVVNFGRSNEHKQDFWALHNVDLEIQSGTTVGLIGPNGSGKSTLLKCIGGIISPTSGLVERRGRLAALLELGAGFHPDLTGRENVFLNASVMGLSQSQTEKHFDAIVDFSGIERFIDTQVKFYSSGMYVRLAFAVAVHVDPDILLVDEVLAVGDEPFQRKCMDRIRSFQHEGRTIILVSHALDQVAEICDRAVVLEGGRVQVDGDPYDALRHLRADFEVTRQEEIERERIIEPESAPPMARISEVKILDNEGSPLVAMHPGDDLNVQMIVDAPDGLTDWIVGIGIDSNLGQVIFGTNSMLMKVALPEIHGKHVVTMRLPNVWINEGSYTLHAAIADRGGVEIERIRDAASIQVHSDGHSIGFVKAEAEVTVD
jgi:ABC-2 type transport system ATP-binding protein